VLVPVVASVSAWLFCSHEQTIALNPLRQLMIFSCAASKKSIVLEGMPAEEFYTKNATDLDF